MAQNATPGRDERQEARREHILRVLMARVTQDESRRAEALRDYLAVTQAVREAAAADTLALMVPPLMPALYRRWIGMFIARLFETASPEQLDVLCDGSPENDGALALAFLMFLESERMEKQTAEDLRAFAQAAPESGVDGRMADLAASYLRARVADLAGQQAERDAKAKKDN
jgi:hypothetical protein